MSPSRVVASLAVTAAALALMAHGSAAPLPYHAHGTAELRLSWSARPERIEVCRVLTAEELSRLEEHMRQRVKCDGRFATYTLRVAVDGRPVEESLVRGAGLRHDRPIYLLRKHAIEPGAHRVHVTLTRREKTDSSGASPAAPVAPDADTGLFAGRAQREASERARRKRAAVPALLSLDSTLVFASRRVALVTFDPERRALVLVSGAAP